MTTVAELLAYLSQFPSETPVLISAGSADYWGRTPLSAPALAQHQLAQVEYSEYHRAFIASGEDEAAEGQAVLNAVIL